MIIVQLREQNIVTRAKARSKEDILKKLKTRASRKPATCNEQETLEEVAERAWNKSPQPEYALKAIEAWSKTKQEQVLAAPCYLFAELLTNSSTLGIRSRFFDPRAQPMDVW